MEGVKKSTRVLFLILFQTLCKSVRRARSTVELCANMSYKHTGETDND